MRRFWFLMLLAAGFAACSDEEETLGGKDIQFAEGTSDKIEVYADETEGTAEGGISFTTTGPWRATVTPVTKAGGADWLAGDESRRRGLVVCGHEGGGRDELGGCGA